MASAFEVALQEGIRDIVDSDLGQPVTYSQPAGDFEVSCVWREGASVEQIRPQAIASAMVALEDFEESPRVHPEEGDQIRKDSKVYEVRDIELNGVGAAMLYLRFLRRES